MQSLQNYLLIASPSMDDPYFARTVTYICEHNENGAMGLVINQPVGMKLKELVEQIDEKAEVIDEKTPLQAEENTGQNPQVANLFQGKNPFLSFKKQFKDIQELNTKPEPPKPEKKQSSAPYDEYLEMLNSSFINLTLMQDQDVIDIKCPLPVDDAIGLSDQPNERKFMQEQE